jgi:hypothetical protein
LLLLTVAISIVDTKDVQAVDYIHDIEMNTGRLPTVYSMLNRKVSANGTSEAIIVLPVSLRVLPFPDLTVVEKYEQWVDLEVKSYNITYTIGNKGNNPSGSCQTRVYIDAGIYDVKYPCPALAANVTHTNTVGPFTMSGENDSILVYADPDTDVSESDEDNNYLRNDFYRSYDIDIALGWTMISLPLIPDSTDINDIISAANLASGNPANVQLVYSYNTSSGQWIWWNGSPSSTLTTIVDGRGYWVNATAADTLTIHGTEAGHPGPDYSVLTGWDQIGFTSTTTMAPETYLATVLADCGLLYQWTGSAWNWWMNGNPSSSLTNMEPSNGYWLNMSAEGIITPP